MTVDEIKDYERRISAAYAMANTAESTYRTMKADMFVKLSNPTDGSKKPSETLINSMIDSNPAIVAARNAANKASAELDVIKMVFKALSRTDA